MFSKNLKKECVMAEKMDVSRLIIETDLSEGQCYFV